METLKTGDLAFFDTFAGLVPCKVLKISKYQGRDNGQTIADVKLTANRQAYKRGEIVTGMPTCYVIPRKAVRKGKYTSRILPYDVEIDATN